MGRLSYKEDSIVFDEMIRQIQDPEDIIGRDIFLLTDWKDLNINEPRVIVHLPDRAGTIFENAASVFKERNYGLAGYKMQDGERVEIYVKDYLPLSYYEGRFEDPLFCRSVNYRNRDEALVALMDKPPRRVFEFAGASGLLAEVMLTVYSSIQFYHHTDLSPLACKRAFWAMTEALAKSDTANTVYSEPMDVIWDRPDLTKYDLVTTTSMEHLPKGTDLRIIEETSPGTTLLFSLTSFGKVGHPHPFPTEEYIHNRYDGLIKIEKLLFYERLSVWLMMGIKR
jgi:hypothetical protein